MSARAEFAPIRERLAGKWQIPLLLLSVALLVGSLLQLQPPEARIPLDTLVKRIDAEVEGGMYGLAIADCRKLLSSRSDGPKANEPDSEPSAEEGRIHLLLARALAMRAEHHRRRDEATAREVLDAYERAQAAGQQLAWRDHRRVGRAQEWLGWFDAAVVSYEQATIDAGSEALDIRKRTLELLRYPLKAPAIQMHEALDALLAEGHSRPDLLQWGVTRKVELLASEGRSDDALSLLEDLRPVFEPTAYREPFEYVVAWVLYGAGRCDEAEAALRDLRNRHTVRDEVHAMSGWLLGRVVLHDG
ncbi:MAG: hypothetical protein ACYS7M_07080, partial [Planctomycetota bacterium]